MRDISSDIKHTMMLYYAEGQHNPICSEGTINNLVRALKKVTEDDGRLLFSLSSCLDSCLIVRTCKEGTIFDKMLTYAAGEIQFMSNL